MAKKRKPGFDSIVEMVDGFLHEFQAETDRGTVVVGGAYLDDLLAGMLRKHFVNDPKIVDEMLDMNGALGSFSSRINLAYCLGLIRDDEFRDLNTVRKIRNEFAHSHGSLSFGEPPVCDFCDNLGQIGLMARLRDQMSPFERELLIDQFKTRRQKFIGNAVHLAVGLMVRGSGLTHRQVGGAVSSDGPKLRFERSDR